MTSNKAWQSLLPHFDLPELSPDPFPNNSHSVALILQTYYAGILQPFEEVYRKNMMAEQQKKAQLFSRPGGQPQGTPSQMSAHSMQASASGQNQRGPPPGTPTANSMLPPTTPQTPHQRPSSSGLGTQHLGHGPPQNSSSSDSSGQPVNGHLSDANPLDSDGQGLKRKLESDDPESKRVRQKTGQLSLHCRHFRTETSLQILKHPILPP